MTDAGERALYEYPDISAAEFERRLALAIAELDTSELEEIRAHIRWFRRRYPTPLDRLRYARRKYADWARTRGVLVHPR
ncbi:MAG: hypothetical protein KF764_01385 [Labilithrix sp.]|nr:hypothetical protein [Labilithrix sp.]